MDAKYDTRNTTNVVDNRDDLIPEEKPSLDATMSQHYPREQLMRYMLLIQTLVAPVDGVVTWTERKALQLLREFKMRLHNLDVTGVGHIGKVLNHLYQTVMLALHLDEQGHTVHLLEATTSDGIKVLLDVDLVTSYKGLVTIWDYTQRDVETFATVVHAGSDKLLTEKSLKLKQIWPSLECHRKIVSNPKTNMFDSINVSYAKVESKEFADDFTWIDSVIPVVQSMKVGEVRQLLINFADKFKNHQLPKLIKPCGKVAHFFSQHKPALVECARYNSPETAATYMRFDQEAASVDPEGYGCAEFKRLTELPTSELFKFPNAKRHLQMPTKSPFDRLRSFVTTDSSPLSQLLLLSEDGLEHPTQIEADQLKSHPLWPLYDGVKIQRCVHKKSREPTNAVRLTFTGKARCLNDISFNDVDGPLASFVDLHLKQPRTELNYEELETKLKSVEEDLSTASEGSVFLTDLKLLISSVFEGTKVGETTQKIMRTSFETWSGTLIGSLVAFIQEVSISVAGTAKKNKIVMKGSKAGIKAPNCYLSLDAPTDRKCVVLVNMNAQMGEHTDQAVCIVGDFEATPSCRPYSFGQTSWFNMNGTDLNWGVRLLHTTLSYITLLTESSYLNHTTDKEIHDLFKTRQCLGSMIMTLNSDKFAQISELIRYLFVNGTGTTCGPKDLIEKMSWYNCKTWLEKLICCRMIKMSSMLHVFSANRSKSDISVITRSKVPHPTMDDKVHSFKNITLAFPHENCYLPDDFHCYNSIYICRNFEVMRYKKTVSESLVILKQLDAREKYLETRDKENAWEARWLKMVTSKADLISLINDLDPVALEAGPYSPSPLAVILGYMCTMVEGVVGNQIRLETLNKERFDFQSLLYKMPISETLNNRGSVRRGETSCLLIHDERVVEGKIQHCDQNDRAYSTIMQHYSDAVQDRRYPPLNPTKEYKPVSMTPQDWNILLMYPDRLWPCLLFSYMNGDQHVSKMVHKDQIGPREIAVLNAVSRIVCFFLEETARHIRDREHAAGDQTNLIEIPNKDDIVKSAYNKSMFNRVEGETTMFDSADCSKWGPTMLSPMLYLTLALRVGDKSYRELLLNGFKGFSEKIFKIPDNFFSATLEKAASDSNNVLRALSRLRTMSPRVGSYKDQYIYLPESMHQGILGCSSSCFGADCMRLANFVNNHLYNFTMIKGYLTSDDYVRIMTKKLNVYDEEDLDSKSMMIRRSLSIHHTISKLFGIMRNMAKSTHSTSVLEFNSVFYTPVGSMKADVKSRVSYIDFGHSTDPYQNALRCKNQALEFLRTEGNVLGACWIQLLNTHMSMIQNQNRRLWKQIGSGIFSVPLEFGGYPMLNPLLHAHGPDYLGLVSNYDVTKTQNCHAAVSLITEMTPDFGDMSLTEDDRDAKSRVPTTSRAMVVHLCRRDLRSNRALRDFLTSVPDGLYRTMQFGKAGSSLLRALVGCVRRESADSGEESSYLRMSVPQTPDDAQVFRITKSVFGLYGRVTRLDIHRIAESWAEHKGTLEGGEYKMLGRSFKQCTFPLDYNYLHQLQNEVTSVMSSVVVEKILAVPRFSYKHRAVYSAADTMFVTESVKQFEDDHKPEVLGGKTNVKPLLYLESKMLLQERLEKLTQKKTFFKVFLYESDVENKSLPEKLLLGAYLSGARLLYHKESPVVQHHAQVESNFTFVKAIMSEPIPKSNVAHDVLLPDFRRKYKEKSVGVLDISELLNAHMGTSSVFMFGDARTRQSLWATLASKKGLKFCLVPGKLKPSRNEEICYTNLRDKMYNSGRVLRGEAKGFSFIELKHGVYHHYETLLSQYDVEPREDTKEDVFHVLNTHKLVYVPVTLDVYRGVVLLKADDHIIRFLGPALPEFVSSVTLKCRGFPLTYELVQRMALTSHPRLELFQSEIGSRLVEDHGLDTVAKEDAEDQFLLAMDDGGSDYDDEELLSELIAAEEEDAKVALKQLSEITPDMEDVPEEDPPDPDEAIEVYHDTAGSMMSQQTFLSYVPTSVTLLASKAWSSKVISGVTTVTIRLPFAWAHPVYDGDNSLEKFIDDLSNDNQDPLWKVGFVREVLRNGPAAAVAKSLGWL